LNNYDRLQGLVERRRNVVGNVVDLRNTLKILSKMLMLSE